MLDAAAVRAAAARLRGQIVATPLIGVVLLPGFPVPDGLRVKPELLQPGGSLWFRGALYALLRRLGAPRGILLDGAPPWAAAAAAAAWSARVSARAFLAAPPDARQRRVLEAAGCRWEECAGAAAAAEAADAVRRREGDQRLASTDADVQAGLATAGLELAGVLPAACAAVLVGPAELATAIAAGLAAGGRTTRVEGVAAAGGTAAVAEAAREGLRLDLAAGSVAALERALQANAPAPCCVVLGD